MDKEICYIYKIYSENPDIKEFYIGSTKNFSKRVSVHKNHCKSKDTKVYTYIREHKGWDNFKMKVLESFSCNSLLEKNERERYYINLLKPTLNQNIPCQTNMEWRAINKDHYNSYMKNYMRTYKAKKI